MPTPRGVQRIFALLLLASGLALGAFWWIERGRALPVVASPIERVRRSVLLVTLDTTRPDRLEPYGAQNVATPALARLAEQGAVFERAYAVAPITLVAHTSILTGLYPPQHGVRNNGTHHADDDLVSLAEVLADDGYRTGAFVSAAVLEKRYGLGQGFEVYDDDLSTGRERHPRVVADRPAEAVVDSAFEWLETVGADEDFFLWSHFYDPHANYSPPPPYRDDYRERLYDGEIAYLDSQLGRLFSHPRFRDALVLVIGDHGESMGEHGERTHAHLAYDATLHVPWIMRVPGLAHGLRLADSVSQVDLVPTVLDLLGRRPVAAVAGRSLVPLLEGSNAPSVEPYLYAETHLPFYTYGWSKLRVLRRGDWKYIAARGEELFDTRRDPRELANRADGNPNRLHDMGRDLGERLAEWQDEERDSTLEIDLEAAEKLRNLGYLSVGSGAARPEEERPDPKDMIEEHVNFERARQLSTLGLHDEAIESLQRVLREDSGHLAALIDLAQNLIEVDRLNDAKAAVERALQLDPDYLRLYLLAATVESRQGRQHEALALIDSALAINPRYLEAMVRRANQLGTVGEAVAAREQLSAALELYPDDPRLNGLYAQRVELVRGDVEAAEARLRRALDRDPFMNGLYTLLGNLLERVGRREEAIEAFQTGLERGSPDDAALHSRLGTVLAAEGDKPAAETHLQEALRLSKRTLVDVHVTLGALLAEQGRFEEANEQYAHALARDPDHAGARNNQAIAFYSTGKIDEAEAILADLVVEIPTYADAHTNLSAILIDRRDWPAAERHSRAAVVAEPLAMEAWNNLGLSVEEQGRLGEALEYYRKALEIDDSYWQARNNMAVVHRKEGRWIEAATGFEGVLRQVPRLADVHFELGALYADHLADVRRARVHWNAFLKARPNEGRSAEVRRRLAGLPSGS